MDGLIYIFTGEGKGKTSAALGMALRAICAGLTVAWIAWYKDPTWQVSEYAAGKLLGQGFSMFIGGKGFYFADQARIKLTKTGAVVDQTTPLAHREAAQAALQQLRDVLNKKTAQVVICDELAQAAGDGLIATDELMQILKMRGATHVVITGRHCPTALAQMADTVTEMRKVKHAYDQGIMAVRGLDF